jgi:pyruvate dehydrogenase complex dehydrogenase (E1) component
VLSSVVPTCMSYDPAFAYEIAVIIQDGIRRMYENNEDHFYYLTVGNENYVQPPMPEGPWDSRRNSARALSIQVFGSRTGTGHPVWKRIYPQ